MSTEMRTFTPASVPCARYKWRMRGDAAGPADLGPDDTGSNAVRADDARPEGASNDVADAMDTLAFERIAFFSDAVMAIAITLLALDVRLPTLDHHDPAVLTQALLDLAPRYFGFVLSFLVVAAYWLAHHRMFRVLRRYDEAFIWLNIVFLLCIAFIPFASSVLGEYGDQRPAAVFYALVIVVTGLVQTSLWLYATRNGRLIDAPPADRAIRLGTLRALMPVLVFLPSLPLVLIHPYVAMLAWVLVFPIVAAMFQIEQRLRQRG